MAGESAHFGLRQRPPTPAIRSFELPPRMQPMLDRARAALAKPFHGIGTGPGGAITPGITPLIHLCAREIGARSPQGHPKWPLAARSDQ